jgi:CRP/FNR family transcriptional regulator, cyclic AMP receptor protein
MSFIEPIGYLASALVLAAFCMRDMVTLRWLAIASNLAFIAYGVLAGLGPVLVLHLLLLPVNTCRLIDAKRTAKADENAAPPLHGVESRRASRCG